MGLGPTGPATLATRRGTIQALATQTKAHTGEARGKADDDQPANTNVPTRARSVSDNTEHGASDQVDHVEQVSCSGHHQH